MRLDGDPPLLFEIHRIEQLILHFPIGNGPGPMQEPVGERSFPVIDMGDDAEISYVRRVHLTNDDSRRSTV
jgi:hypothetical protein